MERSDAELLRAAQSGDVAGTAALLERHQARMRAIAVSMLGAGADVEDTVQEAALVALTRIHTVRDPDAAGAWLAGLTRNLSRQVLSRRAGHWTDAIDIEKIADRAADPALLLDTKANTDWVWQAINRLTDPLRHAVVLRYFSRASSYDAIAAVLGVPVGTVRSRLSEARRTLTTALSDLADAAYAVQSRVAEARTAQFHGIYDEYNHGSHCPSFRSALIPEAELLQGGVPVEHGRERIGDWLVSDIDVGVQMVLLDVIAGAGITVVEGAFVNPPDHPDHCPTGTTHVYLHDGDGIASVRLYYVDDPQATTASAFAETG